MQFSKNTSTGTSKGFLIKTDISFNYYYWCSRYCLVKLIFHLQIKKLKKLFQMKNLKLLNKKYLSIILFYLFFGFAQSQEPIDIWNIEEKKTTENIDVIEE